MKVFLGTCMKCLGKICFYLTMLFLFISLDILLWHLGITIYHAGIKNTGAAIVLIIYYAILIIGCLLLHIFSFSVFIDIDKTKNNIAKIITNVIYRENKKPCSICLSLPICQEQRQCNDLAEFNYKKERCFFKITNSLETFNF